jgi:cytochrome c biogenesis protein CcdA/thiol-disulfide isomerase/thioredoxin
MITVFIGFLAGVITSISPCVLPMVPILLADPAVLADEPAAAAAGSGAVAVAVAAPPSTRRSVRPYLIVAGLVLSFSLSALFGSLLLDALHLPQDFLRNAGIVVLALIGLGLLSHRFSSILEKPFARLPKRAVDTGGNGFVLGMGMGLLFAPCAGPVLATIAVVGATHRFGLHTAALTFAFALGAALPLLILALARDAIFTRAGFLRRHAGRVRTAGGVVMLVMALALTFSWTDSLQRHVPRYTEVLQDHVEGNQDAAGRLRALVADDTTAASPLATGEGCAADSEVLQQCGPAPEFTGVTDWLNTPDGKPLSLAGLRGKVVLIDFWTYSCINCQRTLPYVEGWANKYAKDGLVVVGVHSPEFAFEHVRSNVVSQAAALGVKYPIAMDNDFKTWTAYSNEYWPAEYLIDARGNVRHRSFGEGDYSISEKLIRQALAEAHADADLGQPLVTEAPEPLTVGTQETYLGYKHGLAMSGTRGKERRDVPAAYRFGGRLFQDTFALDGRWTLGPESISAGRNGARLRLDYQADKVFLVLGGTGTVRVQLDGKDIATVDVKDAPTLYNLVSRDSKGERGVLTLTFSKGVQAFAFTFG